MRFSLNFNVPKRSNSQRISWNHNQLTFAVKVICAFFSLSCENVWQKGQKIFWLSYLSFKVEIKIYRKLRGESEQNVIVIGLFVCCAAKEKKTVITLRRCQFVRLCVTVCNSWLAIKPEKNTHSRTPSECISHLATSINKRKEKRREKKKHESSR